MPITAVKPPPLVHANGRRFKNGASKFAMLQGVVRSAARMAAKEREDRDSGDAQKRAKLMLASKANLHFSDDMPRGKFTMIDPESLPEIEKAEAEAAGVTSRTLVLHPDDLDQAIEQFSKPKADA